METKESFLLSAQGVEKYLTSACRHLELHVLPVTGSTNTLLREKARDGAKEGCTVIAGAQTSGRGRLGRNFYSPPDTGVYLSILLRPLSLAPSEAVAFTTMAAVAACEAIEKVSGRQAQIKWVNDIFMDGKKVSGILTEASLRPKSGKIDSIVLGIGINVYPPENGFPADLGQIAGSVFQERKRRRPEQAGRRFFESLYGILHGGQPLRLCGKISCQKPCHRQRNFHTPSRRNQAGNGAGCGPAMPPDRAI